MADVFVRTCNTEPPIYFLVSVSQHVHDHNYYRSVVHGTVTVQLLVYVGTRAPYLE